MKLKSGAKILGLCLIALSLSSCIEFLEVLGALSAFSAETPMPLVRAELGQPVWSGKDEQGFDVDRFQLARTYLRLPRAVPTFTGTPTEPLAGGTEINVTVTYDERKRVRAIKAQDHEGKEIPLEDIVRRK